MEQAIRNDENRELRITRMLNAPIELVWEVWTDPEHIAKWWGPDGFTNTIHKMEVQDGGEWHLTMYGPDGKSYANKSTFKEIVPLKKIVFQHFNPHYLGTVVFEPKGNETFMEWSMQFETTELYDAVVKTFRADEGLKQNGEKLSAYIENLKR